ncbi:MAG: hypothetical protein V4617_01415 [Gemmatimonadota bacterium]
MIAPPLVNASAPPRLRLNAVLAIAVACSASPALPLHASLHAQPASVAQQPGTAEQMLLRADSISVGDYCRVATRTLASAAVVRAMAEDSTSARLGAASICDPLLSDFSLRAMRGDAPAPLASVARVRVGGYAAVRRTVFDAMDEFRAAARAPQVRDVLRQNGDTALSASLVRVTETAHALLVLAARDSALARLGRYERKLGPTSAKLNAPETLLNYAAQRWVPGFAPSPLRGPSPLEIVASYVPTYATLADKRAQAVSASEFGVRYYLFGERFGAQGLRGILFPTYWSAGALVTSDRNGALVWPWDGRQRTGAFVSWGALKVGYVSGRRGSWLVSRQMQIIPFVF